MNKTYRVSALTFLFFFCFHTTVFCQADSLKRLIASNVHDTIRVNLLNTLAKAYFNDNPDTAILIAASSKKLAEEINYQTGLALALKNTGYGYCLKGEYTSAD